MPVREISPNRSSEHAALVNELTNEWTNPKSHQGEPLILVEKDRAGRPAHVYVIWEKWSHVERGERSEIIVESAEKSLSTDQAQNISIAMGLTQSEAGHLGLKF